MSFFWQKLEKTGKGWWANKAAKRRFVERLQNNLLPIFGRIIKNVFIIKLLELSPPFLKSLFPLPSFLFQPLLRYFRQFPPLSRNHLLPPNPTHQPTLHKINGFKQISKEWFLNPYTNISGYLKLWDIFTFIFRQLRTTFFIKLWWQKKFFLNTILQRVK